MGRCDSCEGGVGGMGAGNIISNNCIYVKYNQIDILTKTLEQLMGDQVTTPGRRHVADGWSIVGSQRWLIGYPSHHQKAYVVPTLGQRYQPNGWVAHVGPALGERWHANHDVRPTIPTMYQRRINVLLLTGQCLSALKMCPVHGKVYSIHQIM